MKNAHVDIVVSMFWDISWKRVPAVQNPGIYKILEQICLYSVDFQKRGLRQIHLLLCLRLFIVHLFVVYVISADIPGCKDETILVKCHMLHGPCGNLNKNSVCMNDSKCKYKKIIF